MSIININFYNKITKIKIKRDYQEINHLWLREHSWNYSLSNKHLLAYQWKEKSGLLKGDITPLNQIVLHSLFYLVPSLESQVSWYFEGEGETHAHLEANQSLGRTGREGEVTLYAEKPFIWLWESPWIPSPLRPTAVRDTWSQLLLHNSRRGEGTLTLTHA